MSTVSRRRREILAYAKDFRVASSVSSGYCAPATDQNLNFLGLNQIEKKEVKKGEKKRPF